MDLIGYKMPETRPLGYSSGKKPHHCYSRKACSLPAAGISSLANETTLLVEEFQPFQVENGSWNLTCKTVFAKRQTLKLSEIPYFLRNFSLEKIF
ncbi:hypothetical protein Leryth_026327 [Lithospermum erythrorhizon]|nr:hypothetical protein Leryth_026327 [Lithospermum erythrorhizon]